MVSNFCGPHFYLTLPLRSAFLHSAFRTRAMSSRRLLHSVLLRLTKAEVTPSLPKVSTLSIGLGQFSCASLR